MPDLEAKCIKYRNYSNCVARSVCDLRISLMPAVYGFYFNKSNNSNFFVQDAQQQYRALVLPHVRRFFRCKCSVVPDGRAMLSISHFHSAILRFAIFSCGDMWRARLHLKYCDDGQLKERICTAFNESLWKCDMESIARPSGTTKHLHRKKRRTCGSTNALNCCCAPWTK